MMKVKSCVPLLFVSSLSHQVAVAGCFHGHMDGIYSTLLLAQEREGVSIDVLLCCGDFQVHYTTIMAALNYQWISFDMIHCTLD